MSATQPPIVPPPDPQAQAKRLLRISRIGALATLDRTAGAPLTTLVSVGCDHDGAPLLLLSTLAQHTKNLTADARASLLLTSPARRGDPLNQPRLTVGGKILAHPAPSGRARFLVRNPKSKLYASFADFAIFRFDISAVHFNGGFGRAAALAPADILTDLTGAESLLEAETGLLAAINARGGADLATLAGEEERRKGRRWRAIGLDPDGLDLASGAQAARLAFGAPALTPQAWRRALAARGNGRTS
jgi:putative heme iron utilization protein